MCPLICLLCYPPTETSNKMVAKLLPICVTIGLVRGARAPVAAAPACVSTTTYWAHVPAPLPAPWGRHPNPPLIPVTK